MTEIKPFPNQPLDKILRIFKKKCEKSGLLKDIKRKSFYLKPSVMKREKSKAARKRLRKERRRRGLD